MWWNGLNKPGAEPVQKFRAYHEVEQLQILKRPHKLAHSCHLTENVVKCLSYHQFYQEATITNNLQRALLVAQPLWRFPLAPAYLCLRHSTAKEETTESRTEKKGAVSSEEKIEQKGTYRKLISPPV